MKKYNKMIAVMHGNRWGLLRSIGRTALVLSLGLCLLTGAAASVLFEQLPATGNDAFPSISTAQSADNFTLPTDATVSRLIWWGSYSDDPANLSADAFHVRLFADNGFGRPATTPTDEITQAPTRTPTTLVDITGAVVYRYEIALLNPLTLTGGTPFYLSVVNFFDIGDPNASWYWLLSDNTGANFYRFASDDSWQQGTTGNFPGNFAFAIATTTSIPLPGTLVLLLPGLIGLDLAVRRRR